jgi:multicomponent Na+:H+ antiporter subunit G
MNSLIDILSFILLSAGGFFMLTGAIGLLRMPSFCTRLHAAGVTDAMGLPLILLGLMLQSGISLVTVKLLLLAIFMLLTSPTACHALAKAASIDTKVSMERSS